MWVREGWRGAREPDAAGRDESGARRPRRAVVGADGGLRFTAPAHTAGVESRVTAHSGRVGLASELTSRGASTTDVMLAGNSKTSRMVAHYICRREGGTRCRCTLPVRTAEVGDAQAVEKRPASAHPVARSRQRTTASSLFEVDRGARSTAMKSLRAAVSRPPPTRPPQGQKFRGILRGVSRVPPARARHAEMGQAWRTAGRIEARPCAVLPLSEELHISDLMQMQLPEGSLNLLLVTRFFVAFRRPIKVEYTIPTICHASMVRSRQP